MQTNIFEITLNKFGQDEPWKVLHWLAFDAFDAHHEFLHWINQTDDEQYHAPLEITSVKKVMSVKNIVNAEWYSYDLEEKMEQEGGWDGSEPLEYAKEMDDENVMVFNCECKKALRVAKGSWPYVVCPECQNKILRSEIKEAGGIFFYVKSEPPSNNSGKKK